jgi:hypothetical protein
MEKRQGDKNLLGKPRGNRQFEKHKYGWMIILK